MRMQLRSLARLGLAFAVALCGCGKKESKVGGGGPPTVVSTSPASGALKTQLTLPVRATFSVGMDGGTLTATSFVLTKGPAAAPVVGSVTYESASSTAVFTPAGGRLDYGTPYTATVTAAVKDAGGTAMASPHAWSFTTKTNLSVKAAEHYSVALQDDGTVWTWGDNRTLGMGRDIGLNVDPVPARVVMPTTHPIKLIAAGLGHTLAVDDGDRIYAWGQNFFGELGDGTTTQRLAPALVSMPALPPGVHISAVAAGTYHSLALASDGKVYAWGRNGVGELGDGTTTDRTTPVEVAGLTGVTAIEAGYEVGEQGFSLALKSDGTVWGWGSNWTFELAHDVTAGGCGAECFDYAVAPVQLHGLSNITAIAAGHAFGLALNGTGNVLGWGWNLMGQLGNGECGVADTFVPGFVRASAAGATPLAGVAGIVASKIGTGSNAHALAVKADGTVWGWGYNFDGVVGDGGSGSTATCANSPDIPNLQLYPSQAVGLAGVAAVSAGDRHTLALKADGTVWVWGSNQGDILGVDPSVTANPVLTPEKVPSF